MTETHVQPGETASSRNQWLEGPFAGNGVPDAKREQQRKAMGL